MHTNRVGLDNAVRRDGKNKACNVLASPRRDADERLNYQRNTHRTTNYRSEESANYEATNLSCLMYRSHHSLARSVQHRERNPIFPHYLSVRRRFTAPNFEICKEYNHSQHFSSLGPLDSFSFVLFSASLGTFRNIASACLRQMNAVYAWQQDFAERTPPLSLPVLLRRSIRPMPGKGYCEYNLRPEIRLAALAPAHVSVYSQGRRV